jgi:hypothetical protein
MISYRYISGGGLIYRQGKEQILEEELRDPIILDIVTKSCELAVINIDSALEAIEKYYNTLMKDKMDNMSKEELDEVCRKPTIITSDGTLIKDVRKFLYSRLRETMCSKTLKMFESEEDCVRINNRLIPLSSYAKPPLVKNKKSRKRLLERLNLKYRRIHRPLPMLHGDFDGDQLNIMAHTNLPAFVTYAEYFARRNETLDFDGDVKL